MAASHPASVPGRSTVSFRVLGAEHRSGLEGLPLAPFGRRLLAFALDMAFVSLVLVATTIPTVLAHVRRKEDYHAEVNPFHGWYILGPVIYFGLLTWWGKGRTPGKRLCRIRVISLTHSHLSLWHSLERALGYGASALEAGFGFVQYFIHPNRQTVHDRIAETIVISEPRKPKAR